MTESDYQSICRKNAERFLKTAFVLDDIPEKVDRVIKQKVTSLARPSKGVPLSPSDYEGTTEIPETSLDCEVLIEMFMQKGIICSIIQPKDKKNVSNLRNNLIAAIENVDLPILDWNLFKDDGDTIISVLKHLMEVRSYPEGRVSLILIYTREPIPDAMIRLQDEFNRRLIPDQDRDNVLAMKGLRIVLVNRLSIVEEKLPDLIIDEFSEAHRGILENGVMQAISEIREKTYHVLNRFPAELDAPFISHRAALDIPGDAGNHVFDLITSEIHSLLTQSDLPGRIHQATIQQIVQDISGSDLNSILRDNCPKDRIPMIRKELLELLENGIEPHSRFTTLLDSTYTSLPRPNKDKKRKNLISALTKLLAGDNTSELDAEFSELMTFQHKYPGFSPQLTLGTIVYKPEGRWSKTYYVCVMPICDCAHLTAPVSFPFLPLELPTTGNPSFHLTINHNSVRKEFRVNYSIENIKPFKFEPTSTSGGKILASNNIFETVYGAEFEWIGSLKREFAQRIANKFGSEISQVGLNDSEWQRLSAK